jgi:hypothetical protein
MAHPGLLGGMTRPCAVRGAALVGWTPRAAPASPPEAALTMAVLALSTTPGGGLSMANAGARSPGPDFGATPGGEAHELDVYEAPPRPPKNKMPSQAYVQEKKKQSGMY